METFRDAFFGQTVRYISGGRLFKYPEEKDGFVCPWDVQRAIDKVDSQSSEPVSGAEDNDPEKPGEPKEAYEPQPIPEDDVLTDLEKYPTQIDRPRASRNVSTMSRTTTISRVLSREQTRQYSMERYKTELEEAVQRQQSNVILPQKTDEGVILVSWYTTDDQENPQNWSLTKKVAACTILWLYTFGVYCSSAIYTPGEMGLMAEFGVGLPKASLGLAVFVLGYGIGPMLFSPLSEIPSIGRNLPYVPTYFLFVILGIPLAVVDNYAGFLVLRFLTGFFGSPCLATGGASIGDMFSFMKLPYGLSIWVSAAFCAPALGPLLSGFAVVVKGWRWSLWEIVWLNAPIMVAMVLFYPETSAANILLRRARRLRKVTGNDNYRSQSELDQADMTIASITQEALYKPVLINFLDPAVLFTNVYTALIYGIYYSFFEVFPLVFIEGYGFNLGEMGITFTSITVACALGITIYGCYVYFYLEPDIVKNGMRANEHRLVPALIASFALPIGLFIFAWTSVPSIHWIVPIIGIGLFATGAFVLMQCVFIYLPMSYPQYAASLFAANDLWRSCMAAGSIMYAHALFTQLGIGPGVSLLAGLACAGVIGIWLLWWFGARLRAKSRFATSD